MGRLQKKLVVKISEITKNCKSSKKQLSLSIVSLIISSMILISTTFCWYALSKATGTMSNVNLEVGNGLRINDLDSAMKDIKDHSYLLPASSVDGRNLFFPTDGTDFSTTTSAMTFRSANAGDRNYSYVQLDFNLTAEADYTSIYLQKDSIVDVKDDKKELSSEDLVKIKNSIRTAIYYEGMDSPRVFTSLNNPQSTKAVKDIDRTTGKFLESDTQVAYPFNDYTFGKRQLAMLNKGETRPFSLIIWLEGTDPACVSDPVMLKQLEIKLTFTTSWDNTETIQFEDNTITSDGKSAVSEFLDKNPGYSLKLNYTNTSNKIKDLKFTMYRTSMENNKIWKCNIPSIFSNEISFQIVSDSDKNDIAYEWKVNESGEPTLNRSTSTKYICESFGENKCYGHWYDGDIEENGDGRDENIGDIDDGDW